MDLRGPPEAETSERETLRTSSVSVPVSAGSLPASALFDDQGRYRAGALLGRGGMGEVRLVADRRIGREVAVKSLRVRAAEGSEAWERFVREARVQGQLEHPAVVPVYDFGVGAEGEPYFSMRRVQGESLETILDRLVAGDEETVARWSRRKLLNAFVQVCLAIDYAHARGVVHRDLKPANIMLGEFGEVQVIDWGVARLLGERGDASREAGLDPSALAEAPTAQYPLPRAQTAEGALMGTPMYMPLEQLAGDLGQIGPQTDVFALGMILYEVLALRSFHEGRSLGHIFDLALKGFEPRPSAVDPECPAELDAACVRATRPNLAERTPSARALAEEVERYLDGESDRSRRRDLAAEHAAKARDLVGSLGATPSASARQEALREALQALALDPAQPEARAAFSSLLTSLPEALPPPVERELEEKFHAARRRGVVVGAFGWFIWAASAPILFYLGVRSWSVVIGALSLCALGLAESLWLWRKPVLSRRHVLLYAATFAAFAGGMSAWMGPFVLVPTVAASLLMFGVVYGRAGERAMMVAVSVLAVVMPLALEALGVVGESYRFVPEGVLILPRTLALEPVRTTAALLWSCLGFITFPALLLGRLRDDLAGAERHIALQAWQLRQLTEAPDDRA
ncbi:MAG: serine/threonine-protein kinase [Polyangiales bacterium]